MSLLVFIGSLFFFFYPKISRRNFSFIDLYILFCLYFDAMLAFSGNQSINLMYFQYFLMLIFSIYYYSIEVNQFSGFAGKLLISVIFFLLALFFIPIIRGSNLNETLRNLAPNITSLMILPISFHYYSKKGNIINLIHSGYYFILLWTLTVIIFTVFKIDYIQPTLKGYWPHSIVHGGGIFYFGKMSVKGAITYISFALLLVPLILKHVSYLRRVTVFFNTGFILAVLFVALKRFTFVVILFGLFNYLYKSTISRKTKTRIVAGSFSVIFILFIFTNLASIVKYRYWDRGGDNKFSENAIQGDLRIYEPIYVLESAFSASLTDILFGLQLDRTFDISSDMHDVADRQIHNQYAQYILMYGLVGLFSYLYIFYILYRITFTLKKKLIKMHIDVIDFWIVFQNLILIFLASGMVGGHIHVTFRGLVFVFAGGISGYFYKLLKVKSLENT